jgi:hypothetical protein
MNLPAEMLDDHQRILVTRFPMIEEEKNAVSDTGSYFVSLGKWITQEWMY